MAQFRQQARWNVDIQQDWIDVTSERESSDPHWRATDSSGHEHHYASGYPTLEFVIDASHWCDGNEGYARHDPHEHIDEAHYECRICREVVEPGTLPPYYPQQIAGLRRATGTARLDDGREVTVALIDSEIDAIRQSADDEQRIIDVFASVPAERVLRTEFNS